MSRLFILPLEILAERYTEQWYRWFYYELDRMGFDYRYIDGKPLSEEVRDGTVLDAVGTNYYKFTQLQKVCELFDSGFVRDGDAFFTMDLWHPGLEAIRYMATLKDIKVFLFGFLHAGSYTAEDFASPMADWARFHEVGWASACDAIFVGTEYHKQKFYQKRLMPAQEYGTLEKIHAFGNPFLSSEVKEMAGEIKPVQERAQYIIYPNRFDREKRPNIFIDMMNLLHERRQDFVVYFTTSRRHFKSNSPELLDKLTNESTFVYKIEENLSKQRYYRIFKQMKIYVSTTIEENFGYCLLEAITLGVCPIVPKAYSHPEILFDPDYMYNHHNFMYPPGDLEMAVDMISDHLDKPLTVTGGAIKRYDGSLERIFSKVKEIMGV